MDYSPGCGWGRSTDGKTDRETNAILMISMGNSIIFGFGGWGIPSFSSRKSGKMMIQRCIFFGSLRQRQMDGDGVGGTCLRFVKLGWEEESLKKKLGFFLFLLDLIKAHFCTKHAVGTDFGSVDEDATGCATRKWRIRSLTCIIIGKLHKLRWKLQTHTRLGIHTHITSTLW